VVPRLRYTLHMELVPRLVSAVAAAAIAGFAGYRAGVALRVRPGWWYWAANAGVTLLGIAVTIAGLMTANELVWWFGLGVIAGGLTGLKYGLARVVGRQRVTP
jgi:hypothetical protein